MQAIILAGGKGSRLQPYTTILPKPLMPIGKYPILEVILRQLKTAGVGSVILAVGHLSHLLQAVFQDGSQLGLKITYSQEKEPLGTAGPLALVLDQLEENFLVMNGDLLTTLNTRSLFEHHLKQHAAATIGMYQRDVKIDFGVVESDEEGLLTRYIEKPTYHFNVSMGINALNRELVKPYLVPGKYLDLPDLLMTLRHAGHMVCCYQESCIWLDIGRVDDYQRALEIFEAQQGDFMGEEIG